MNKKAAVLHWIFFGILLALATFTIFKGSVQLGTKGEWHYDFLVDNYLESEKNILEQDIDAKKIGLEIIQELAKGGGFLEENECGVHKQNNLWNNKDNWCFPTIDASLTKISLINFKELFPDRKIVSFGYDGDYYFGKGEMLTLKKEANSYTYQDSFYVDLEYSFDEYLILEQEAKALRNFCQSSSNLKECLEVRGPHWKYCSGEFEAEDRAVAFCVDKTVTYKLALDFTPSKPFELEVNEAIGLVGGKFEVVFPKLDTADSYNIYFTDVLRLLDYQGGQDEIILFPDESVEKITLVESDLQECTPYREQGGYLCEDKIYFVIEDFYLEEGQDYLFAVASILEGKESDVKFVLNS